MKKSTAIVLALLVVPLAAWITKGIVTKRNMPSDDPNIDAYLILCKACKTESVSAAKHYANQAAAGATDPKLRDVAGKFAMIWEQMGRNNIQTKQEANSLDGMIKAAFSSIMSPQTVLGNLAVTINTWNLPEEAARVEAAYRPYCRTVYNKVLAARAEGWSAFVGMLITGWGGFWLARHKLIKEPTPAAAPTETSNNPPEPALITCTSCGTQNRYKAHRAGQKLVCGNCKTQLLAGSCP